MGYAFSASVYVVGWGWAGVTFGFRLKRSWIVEFGLYPHYTVYIYKKKFVTKTKRLKLISNHSMVVSGAYYNPFQGSQGPQEGSEAKILTF